QQTKTIRRNPNNNPGGKSLMRRISRYLLLILVFSSPTTFASGIVKDSARAKPSDVNDAEKFLAQLPPACSESSAYASKDGMVNIRLICHKDGQTMNSLLSIKN